MESSAVRFTIFILLGIAAISGSAALIGVEPTETRAEPVRPAAAPLENGVPRVAPGEPRAPAPNPSALLAAEVRGIEFTPPTPEMRRIRWAWKDDRTQLVFEGCTAVARDARIAEMEVVVETDLDGAGLAALESHFGFELQRLRTYRIRGDERIDDGAWDEFVAEHTAALAKHGILLEGNRVSPDFPWLVERATPLIAPLAQAIARNWRDPGPPPAGAEPSPGNYPRADARVEAFTSFVQRAIPYADVEQSPDGLERCGLRTPGPTLIGGGDCDSKVLLLATLLRAADPRIPLVLVTLTLDDRPHMLLGVGVPAAPCAATLTHAGRKYVLIETTSAVGVGIMAPDYNDARLERFVVIP